MHQSKLMPARLLSFAFYSRVSAAATGKQSLLSCSPTTRSAVSASQFEIGLSLHNGALGNSQSRATSTPGQFDLIAHCTKGGQARFQFRLLIRNVATGLCLKTENCHMDNHKSMRLLAKTINPTIEHRFYRQSAYPAGEDRHGERY